MRSTLPFLLLLTACDGGKPGPSGADSSPDTGGAASRDGGEQGQDVDADGWTVQFGDCDDEDASRNPDTEEVEDGIDNDCDGDIDESGEGGGGPYSSSIQPYLTPGEDFDYATSFRNPLGDGTLYTHCRPDDGWYAYTEHQEYSSCASGGSSYCTATVGTDCARHLGEDWNGEGGGNTDYGDPVYAIGAGEVVYAYNASSGWGNVVIVWHVAPEGGAFTLPDGSEVGEVWSMYAHLSSVSVADGDVVSEGALVGAIGDAGGTYAAHLHWEVAADPAETYPGPGYSSSDRGRVDPTEFITTNATVVGASSGAILVTYPNGGEQYDLGDTVPITWTATGTSGTVKIEFFKGPNLDRTDEFVVEAAGSWDADSGLYAEMTFYSDKFEEGESDYYVCVSDADEDGAPWDCSDGHFSIGDGTSYPDDDSDGYDADTDCDDDDPAVNPSADEVCDGIDNDCDSDIDDDDLSLDLSTTTTWYDDHDGDGYGDPSDNADACEAPRGHVANNDDCDDADSNVHPGATEQCNAADDDCDGTADDSVSYDYWYDDNDGDGYGTDSSETYDCEAPPGYVAYGGDCNDGDDEIHPGASETCNAEDDDCDGRTDEGVSYAYYYDDNDSDGYGAGSGTYACVAPSGYVSNDDDCDDGDSGINPGATESCDGEDEDCDSQIDDDSSCWVAVYRFEDSVTGARCWNTSTSAPSNCSGYTLEIEAWIVPSTNVPDTFHAVQCSKATDHIMVEDGSSDETALRSAGYDCSLSLGYPYDLGSGPASGTTPYSYTCDVWRFSYSTSGGGAHLFTRGADSVSSMTCEDPARFEVVTDESCFSGTPSGC